MAKSKMDDYKERMQKAKSKKETLVKEKTNVKSSVKKESSKKAPSTSSLVEKYRAKLQTLKGSGGSGTGKYNFVKFEEGKNKFRVVDPSSGPTLIFYKRQRGKVSGRFRTVLDLRTLVEDEEFLDAMVEREKLTSKDIKFIKKYGEPYDVLYEAMNSVGKAKKYQSAGIGQKRCMMVVFSDGEFGILDMGIGFGEAILDLLDSNPDITSWQEGMWLSCTKTMGRKWQDTQYGPPIPLMKEVGPLNFEVETDEPVTPNLYDVLAGNTMNYVDKVNFLFNSHGRLVDECGLDVTDFGLTGKDISVDEEDEDDEEDSRSFNYGKNRKAKGKKKVVEDENEEVEEEEEENEGDEEEEEEDDLDEELDEEDEEEDS